MCNPMIAIAAVGLVTQMAGQAQQSEASADAYEAKADSYDQSAALLDEKAKLAEREAKLILVKGDREETQHRIQVSKLVGSQRAGYGASGVLVDSGTALDVQRETESMGDADALTIRFNARHEAYKKNYDAWGHRQDALGMRTAAYNNRKAAKRTRNAGLLGLLGTGASGASDIAYKSKYSTQS